MEQIETFVFLILDEHIHQHPPFTSVFFYSGATRGDETLPSERWARNLGGDFKYCLFPVFPLFGEMIQFDSYFCKGVENTN